MSVLHGVLVFSLLFHSFASEIPLAPYSVKLYCRMGASWTIQSRVTSICPTASTSCGYFEFVVPTVRYPIGVYECVDSSVLVTENDDNEREKEDLFKRYCDDRSRCRMLAVDMLNKQFLLYLANSQGIHAEYSEKARVKFCCAINYILLDKVIESGLNVLPTPAIAQVTCNGEKCAAGAIGCLVYSKEIEQSYVDEIILVRPVQLIFDDYGDQVNKQSDDEHYTGVEYSNEYYCVHKHLNDELYRYCMLVYNERLPNRCYEGNGYRVCCCFFTLDNNTCDPLRQSVITTTVPIPSPTSAVAYAFSLSVTAVYTTTMVAATTTSAPTTVLPSLPSVQNRTSTTTTTSGSYLSNIFLAENDAPVTSTTAQTHFHPNTSLSENDTSETSFVKTTTTVRISTNSVSQHNIPDRDPVQIEPSKDFIIVRNTATTALETITASSTSPALIAKPSISTAPLIRMRCRTIIEERPRFSVKKGEMSTTKKVVCDNEIDSAMSYHYCSATATAVLLIYMLIMPI